jgi:hypothetical protein
VASLCCGQPKYAIGLNWLRRPWDSASDRLRDSYGNTFSFVLTNTIYRIYSNLIRTFFNSFRGLKNQTRIRIECGLDSRSRAVFWKNDGAGVRAVRTIQLFIILFIILYNILKYL